MQGLVLQLTRVGFLLLLWLFIWSVLRILRTDLYAPTGAVMVKRGLALRGTLLPNRNRRHIARRLDSGPHRRLRLDTARPPVPARRRMVRRRPRIDQRYIPRQGEGDDGG